MGGTASQFRFTAVVELNVGNGGKLDGNVGTVGRDAKVVVIVGIVVVVTGAGVVVIVVMIVVIVVVVVTLGNVNPGAKVMYGNGVVLGYFLKLLQSPFVLAIFNNAGQAINFQQTSLKCILATEINYKL